jgi:hypothetical protein
MIIYFDGTKVTIEKNLDTKDLLLPETVLLKDHLLIFQTQLTKNDLTRSITGFHRFLNYNL